MAEFLTETKGFTPVIDVLAKEVGLIPVAVYGVVWRYCQQRNGVCQASLETIGAHLGLTPRTVFRHIHDLCERGFLEDTTPGLRNHPHTYRDTGAVKIQGLIDVKDDRKDTPTTELPARKDCHSENLSARKDLQRHTENLSEPTMKDLPLKRVESKETYMTRVLFSALAELCCINLQLMTDKQRGQLNVEGKKLADADITPDDLRGFGEWWRTVYWKGKDGQAPRPSQVREDWGQYEKWQQTNGKPGTIKTWVS